MRQAVAGSLFALGLLATSCSAGDSTEATTSSPITVAEPITGAPIAPSPGQESPARDPFQPHGIGPRPLAEWPYDTLTPEERAVADRGRNQNYTAVHAGYSDGVRLRTAEARAEAAALQLGIDNLATGVVP